MGFNNAQISSDLSLQSEYDYYWHNMRADSKDLKDFYNKASKPDLKSLNDKDKEPTFHPMGYSFNQI